MTNPSITAASTELKVTEINGSGPGAMLASFSKSKVLILVHRCGIILGPSRTVVFPLPIAILILLVPLMRIGVCAMANIGGRYASLDMPHAEPDLSVTKAHIAGSVIVDIGITETLWHPKFR
jgi:hypothetical protein